MAHQQRVEQDNSLTEPLLSASRLPIEDPLSDAALEEANAITSTQNDDGAGSDERSASFRVSDNATRIIMFSWFTYVGRSVWIPSVVSIFVFLLREDHPECVGVITGVMGLSQALGSLPAATCLGSCNTAMLRASSLAGVSAVSVTAFAVWKKNYHFLIIGLVLCGFMWGISETTINSLVRASIPPSKHIHYYRRASTVTWLANVTGPLIALVVFQIMGDEWTLEGCSVVMAVGLAICLPAFLLLFFIKDRTCPGDGPEGLGPPVEIMVSEENNHHDNEIYRARNTSGYQSELHHVESTDRHDNYCVTDMDEVFALDGTTPCLCRCKDQVAVPTLVKVAILISEVASGFSMCYFPIIFADQLQLSPTQVQLIFVVAPFGGSISKNIARALSKRLDPFLVLASFHVVSVLLLFSLIACYIQGLPVILICLQYFNYASLLSATITLGSTVATNSVAKERMGKWNTLEGLQLLLWSGGAIAGGVLAGFYGVVLNFYITAGLQVVASLPYLSLLRDGTAVVGGPSFPRGAGGFLDRDEENDLSSIPHDHSYAIGDEIVSSRGRLDSSDSSQYFDCSSFHSTTSERVNGPISGLSNPTRICRYTNRRCEYEDGSPSYLHVGDDGGEIPPNYLSVCRGDRNKARGMWIATQKWRQENSVWMIHTIPNIWFPKIKEAYPHFVHGHSKAGYPVIYEQPGRMKLKELFRGGCTIDDMTSWYTFFMEYLSNCICTQHDIRRIQGLDPDNQQLNSSSWGFIVVMDSEGAGVSLLSGDVLAYLKRAGDINSTHYPLSNKHAFVIKVGGLLARAWSALSSVVPDSASVHILSSKKYLSVLREFIVSLVLAELSVIT